MDRAIILDPVKRRQLSLPLETEAAPEALAAPGAAIPTPAIAEVASIKRALDTYSAIQQNQFPNLSTVLRDRSDGQGLSFYDTMLGTDSDLNGFFEAQTDNVLHFPIHVRAAGPEANYQEHARFLDFAVRHVPHFQNALRHLFSCYPRGFAVAEKMFEVVMDGEFKGSVVYADILDKPQRWFSFGVDRQLLFRSLTNPYPGEPVDPAKFLVWTFGSNHNPWGEAVLDLVYWAWYLKHHALKNQAIFFEKWAQPTPVAKYRYSSNQEANKRNVEEAIKVLQSIQIDNSVALPDGIDFSLIESLRQGSVSYQEYITQLTESESRCVTGQVLSSMGTKGGSFALGKVHEGQGANRVAMLARFGSAQISRQMGRDLIDRNYGPQDAYPRIEILYRSPAESEAYVTAQKLLQETGLEFSKSYCQEFYQVVAPIDTEDTLVRAEVVAADKAAAAAEKAAAAAPAPMTVKKSLAEFQFAAAHPAVYAEAKAAGKAKQATNDSIGHAAAKAARPALKHFTQHIAKTVRKAKSPKTLKRSHIFRGMKGYDFSNLGQVAKSIFGGA